MNILYVVDELGYADHIAFAYLSGVSRKRGHQSFFCSLDRQNLVDEIRHCKADIVAYSVHVTGFEMLKKAQAEAKRSQKFLSIMGGPHATFSPETLEESDVDVYCVGEGEGPWNDFLEAVENGRSYDDIPNLVTKNKTNPVRNVIANLDDIPFPDRDLTLANSYLKKTSKKTFYLTRGCPFKCTYCYNSFYHEMYKGKGKFVRRFSVDRMIEEMRYVKANYRMDFVRIGDDLFAIRVDDWLEEFAEKYSKYIGVPFTCYLRLDLVCDRLLKTLKQAGCYSVKLSLDSTSSVVREDILKRSARSRDLSELVKKVRSFHDHGINTWVNYMLAVPESTVQDDLDTIKFSRDAKVTLPHYSTLVPTKGTAIYNYSLAKGYIQKDGHNSDMNGVQQPSTLNCFSKREKEVRFNVYCLGALAAKMPRPLDKLVVLLIKYMKPNRFFIWIRNSFFDYYNEHKIFKLQPEEDDAVPVRDFAKQPKRDKVQVSTLNPSPPVVEGVS